LRKELRRGADLVKKFYEVWNERRFDVLKDLLTPDCLLHFADRSHPMLSEKSRKVQQDWVKSFPDLKFTILDIVEEGDLVAVRLTFEGTQRGEFEGVPATNRRIRVTEMLFAKVQDGKISELWEDYDRLGMMKQLGFSIMKPEKLDARGNANLKLTATIERDQE